MFGHMKIEIVFNGLIRFLLEINYREPLFCLYLAPMMKHETRIMTFSGGS